MRENLELLSAMVDDELDVTTQQSLTDKLLEDAALKGAWRRYNLIGEALRENYARDRERDSRNPGRILTPEIIRNPRATRPSWATRFLPLAATVVVTVMGTIAATNLFQSESSVSDLPALSTDSSSPPTPKPESTPAVTTNNSTIRDTARLAQVDTPPAQPAVKPRTTEMKTDESRLAAIPVTTVRYEESQPMQQDQRLDSYIVNFNEQRVNRGVPGVHPYVRIVGYNAAQ